MNWASILPGIAALLVKFTGLQQAEGDSPPKFTNPTLKAKLEWRVTSCQKIGFEDEWRRVYDADQPDPNLRVTTEVHIQRQFTLSVKCISYDHSFTRSAEYYLERIRTRMGYPSSNAALTALNCSWVDSGPLVNLSSVLTPEDRAFSLGQLDLMFTCAQTFVANEEGDPDDALYDGPMGTIDSVIMTSVYLYDGAGHPLTKQIGPFTVPES